jgi:large subunit ribosomal protein L15
MRLEDAQPQAGSKRRRRRVGRGIAAGQGASCGFGMRGQKSRSGRELVLDLKGDKCPSIGEFPSSSTLR